jgi:hypothetical protein
LLAHYRRTLAHIQLSRQLKNLTHDLLVNPLVIRY